MVLLTTALVEKECLRIQSQKSLTKTIRNNHIRKITHLQMNDKFIYEIGDFSACRNLKVIYLQNNGISRIENLDFAINLTHLYLQHNDIVKIENLDGLRNLEFLFLGYNCISIVEGLENLDKLREFHIENQRLSSGESLIFDPRSLETLSICLRTLNVSGNKIVSLKPLRFFCSLKILDARNNLIENILDVTETITTLRSLSELFLHDNPVTLRYRYRETLIANSDSLVNLDEKIVTPVTRRFLKRFKDEKNHRLAKRIDQRTLSDDITTCLKLPPAFERSVSRAILQQQSGPKWAISVTCAMGDTKPHIFPPWKPISSIAGTKGRHCTPRPFWRAVPKMTKLTVNPSNLRSTEVFPSLRTSKNIAVNIKQIKNP